MKKTPIILGLGLALVVTLAGCNNTTYSENAVVDKLSHELDHVTNTVSSTDETSNKLSVSNISKKFTSVGETSFTKLTDAYQKAKELSTNIEDNSERVLRKAKQIKREVAGGIKLGSENAKAISELTASMQRYTTSLGKTKSDYKNTVKSIAKLDRLDGNEIDAKITRLGCCLQARNCYLNNILNTLNNIETIISSLENEDNNQTVETEETTDEKPLEETINNGFNFNGTNGYGYGYNNGYNGYGYNNGYNGYGYNNGYRGGPFNPNRNTDTYGPGVTNIDTYRNDGFNRHFNGSNGVNNIESNPENEMNDLMLPQDETTKIVTKEEENMPETKEEQSLTNESTSLKKEIKEEKNKSSSPQPIPSKTLRNKTTTVDNKTTTVDNKVKGHTQNAMIDINQKIDKLIKKAD